MLEAFKPSGPGQVFRSLEELSAVIVLAVLKQVNVILRPSFGEVEIIQ